MIILPLGHDELTVRQLPFVTIGIILLCTVIYFSTSSSMEAEGERLGAKLSEVWSAYSEHEYLELPPDIVQILPRPLQKRYNLNQEWVSWHRSSPQEVEQYLEAVKGDSGKRQVLHVLDQLAESSSSRSRRAHDLAQMDPELTANEMQKIYILSRLKKADPEVTAGQQRRLDALSAEFFELKGASISLSYGYIPSESRALTTITHQFLHGGLFHLLFNMFFLWLAGAKLEDLWSRPVYAGAFILFGIAGALAHGVTHSESIIPMIGASGAVAGLMGAFLVRLSRARIQFFYAFWFFYTGPRVGTFEAPAYFMLPLWFVSELFYAIFLDFGGVAYWAHVGGFAGGIALALIFRHSEFEYRVLGRDPQEDERPQPAPLTISNFAYGQQQTATNTSSFGHRPLPAIAHSQSVKSHAAVASHLKTVRMELREILIKTVQSDGLEGLTLGNQVTRIDPSSVIFLAAGRIRTINPEVARLYFTGQIPPEPALIMVLLTTVSESPQLKTVAGFTIDGSRLRYESLLSQTDVALMQNFSRFSQQVLQTCTEAQCLRGEEIRAGRLPLFESVEEFFSMLKKRANAL